MSAKHTPGPWAHCTEGFPRPDVRAANGRAVARTWMVCSGTPKTAAGYQARCEEDRANARLIAAAPDLLEALKQIEPILTRMYGPQAAELPPMQVVRAAIAKAEGH